jgi:hypothetical protein
MGNWESQEQKNRCDEFFVTVLSHSGFPIPDSRFHRNTPGNPGTGLSPLLRSIS